jgi:hypothetical protein
VSLKVFFLCLVCFSAPLFAAPRWLNLHLKSGDAEVFLDFQIRDTLGRGDDHFYSYNAYTIPFWVNVRREGLGPADQVTLMIIRTLGNFNGKAREQQTQEILEWNLEYAEYGRFTRQIPSMRLFHAHSLATDLSTIRISEEVVWWINGQIYKDPATGNNFKLNLWDFSECETRLIL